MPYIGRNMDESGNIVFTPEEWSMFVKWVEELLYKIEQDMTAGGI